MNSSFASMLLLGSALSALGCAAEGGEGMRDDEATSDEAMADEKDGGSSAAPPPVRDAAATTRDASRSHDASASEVPRLDAGRTPEEAANGASAKRDAAFSDSATVADAARTPASTSDAAVARARPSAGCGKNERPSGGRVSVPGEHNVLFPTTYDGQRPYPLLLGFHASGNPIEQIENLTDGSEFEQSFVRAFPKSKGSAWDYPSDIGKVRGLYTSLVDDHCIDLDRVFATGHSSGAQLIVQVLAAGHEADAEHFRFKAVAPVAASRYGAVRRTAVLYIQGMSDTVRRSSGSEVVAEFTAANQCKPTSQASSLGAACMSAGRAVRAGCVEYQGCSAPTVWCSHDDPAYSSTNHGWPCFATKAMFDFFVSSREAERRSGRDPQ